MKEMILWEDNIPHQMLTYSLYAKSFFRKDPNEPSKWTLIDVSTISIILF